MSTQPLVEKSSSSGYVDESRFERIDGQLVPRPMPGDLHAQTQLSVLLLLREQIKPLNARALQEWSVSRPEMANREQSDYLTPDVLVAEQPYRRTDRGHLIPPGFLAVEIASPNQGGLFRKAELYGLWGIEHVWIIDPQTKEAFEYHGGNQFTLVSDRLSAGSISLALSDLWNSIAEKP